MFILGRKARRRKRRWPLLLALFLIVAVVVAVIYAGSWYNKNLQAVSKGVTPTAVDFTVNKGDTVDVIAVNLQKDGLINSPRAFKFYLKLHRQTTKIQAGSYKLSTKMDVPTIATTLVNGFVSRNYVTILPGKTIDQIKLAFEQTGYSKAEVEPAFNTAMYPDEPLVSSLPAGSSLEGLLYPNTFQKDAGTPASTIVRESIEEMQNMLTTDIKNGFSAQGLTEYQGLTLSSIVYQESGNPIYEPTVAQVFLLRLKNGMALGSDVTAFYAANQVGAGKTLGVDSPYNTRIHTGIPPGPISTFTQTALQAVAHPTSTDYLFFVAGDDGVLHFSHTEAEHEQATKQYCTQECS